MVKLVCKIVAFFIFFAWFLSYLSSISSEDILRWNGMVGKMLTETIQGLLPDWMVPNSEEKQEDEKKNEERDAATRTIHYYMVTVNHIDVSVKEQKQNIVSIQQSVNQSITSNNAVMLQQNYLEINQYQVQINQLLTQVNNLQNNLYNINKTNNLTQVDVNNVNKTLKTVNHLKVELNNLYSLTRNIIVNIQQIIDAQKQEENKECYYAIGSEEILLKNAVVSKGLFGKLSVNESGYNSNFYISGKAQDLTRMELYAKKAEILSDMPSDSYQLHEINSFLILVVKDVKKFWSKTNYLVVKTE